MSVAGDIMNRNSSEIDEDEMLKMELSALSCSTADNEDFFVVEDEDEQNKEGHVDNKGDAKDETVKERRIGDFNTSPYRNKSRGDIPRLPNGPVHFGFDKIRQASRPPHMTLLPSLTREGASSSILSFADNQRTASTASAGSALPSSPASFPLIHVSPAGTISLLVAPDLLVEISIDRAIRVVSNDHFAATMNSRGTSSAILHPKTKIIHRENNVWTKFSSANDKMTTFGACGVFFTMSHLQEGYLVSSSNPCRGAVAVPLDPQHFPSMDHDYTMKLFYSEAQTGQQLFPLCQEAVMGATYEKRSDGSLCIHVNGIVLRHHTNGELHIDARPRQLTCNPRDCTLHLRSPFIDMAVQSDEKAFVKRGLKRVHVSRSGMVVSDGNCITSMDHFGRIVSCT